MRGPALRPQRFGWPVVVAVGVHAVLLVAPALDLRSSRSAPDEPPMVQVELVGPSSIPETPVPVPPKPVPVVQSPVSLPPQPAAPVEPVTTTVVEAPKALAPVMQPTRVEAEPAPPTEPEPVMVPLHLSVAVRSKARLGDNPRPVYPRSAREAGWEGTVMLRVEVLENGLSGVVLVHKTCGHEVLDNAALSAVQQWKFVPAMDGAFPVRSVVYLPVQFDLRSAR